MFQTVVFKSCYKDGFKSFIFLSHVLSIQFSSVAQLCLTLQPHGLQHARLPCRSPAPGACSDSVHRVGDAIQPSHPLSSPSPPARNPSQHQSLFQ